MKLLITGGAGFIAPHVANEAAAAGYEPILSDVRSLETNHSFRQADLLSIESLVDVTKDVDAICHLGGVGDVYLAAEKPYVAASGNVVGTANLLEAAKINGISKVVFASTWEVYGPPQYQPIDEKHPLNPDHPYNITKMAAERLVIAYDELHGVPGIALRLGTAYGPGMRENSVFSIFIRKALEQEEITIAGSGEQMRQFTHVTDVAKAFVLAAQSSHRGEVYNVVADEPITIKQLAELVIERLPTTITHTEARPGDVAPALISSEKAKSELGWKPLVDFRDGLGELIGASSR